MTEAWKLGALELADAYRRRDLSPVEALDAILARMDAVDPSLNVFCFRDDPDARRSASDSEGRWRRGEPLGPLDGVPVSVKDLIHVSGMPTRFGSAASDDRPVADDSPSIANLRRGGTVILGKTTTPEFGHKGVTESPLTGVTRNPWNLGMTPGGSSGGAGAALAAGMGPLAVGTDGGGSCRKPANYCGLIGMKPSLGRVPLAATDGAWPLSSPGPMARSVADAAVLLGELAKPATVDPFMLPPMLELEADPPLEGLKVACGLTLAGANARPAIGDGVAATFERFAELGATVEEAVPDIENPMPFYRTLLDSGMAAQAADWSDEQIAMADETFQETIARGRALSAIDLRLAFGQRGVLAASIAAFFADYDLLVLPCNPTTAYEIGPREPEKVQGDTWGATVCFTAPFNITGQPAITVPCGHTEAGLPFGIQIVGPYGRDDLVLRAAAAFETTTGLTGQLAPL